MRRFEISVRAKIIIILILMYIELEFDIVSREVAAVALLALIYLWTFTERRKERRDRQQSAPILLIAESESCNAGSLSLGGKDNVMEKMERDLPGHPGENAQPEHTEGSEEDVASNVVAGGRGEESDDIFAQALRVVAEAEAEHGALRREEAPQHVDIVGMIRALLVQCYGEQWRHANFAHYHTFSGNCLFVAMAVAAHGDTGATVHCRVVEVDPEGHFIFPNPVKVEDVQNE